MSDEELGISCDMLEELPGARRVLGGNRRTILMDRYEIGSRLGHGNFVNIYHARKLYTEEDVAIKIIDKDKVYVSKNKDKVSRVVQLAKIEREVSIVRMTRHPNIVQILEVMADKSKIYFVLEFVRGGELFERMSKGKFSENVARGYFRQLISAMEYCHSRGVYHGDLRPQNLLLDEDGNLKVLGFGSSSISESKRQVVLLNSTSGTPAYVAPEVLSRKGSDGFKADMWSCGEILFVLVAGYLPFPDIHLAEVYRWICRAEYRCPPSFSSELKDLLYKILDPDVGTRISISRIKRSAWYKKNIAVIPHERRNSPESSDSEGVQVLPIHRVLNAFAIISLSMGFDLPSLLVERYDRMEEAFTTRYPAHTILGKLNELAMRSKLKFYCVNRNKFWYGSERKEENDFLILEAPEQGLDGFVQIRVQVSEFAPSILLVELSRYNGYYVDYKQLMKVEIGLHLRILLGCGSR